MAIRRRPDIVVVGGGLAGLATAVFLACRSKTVLLLEQARSLGGRAQTKTVEGFAFNLGPHALYRAGRGIEILKELGVVPRGKTPSVSGAFAIKRGSEHTFPAGAVSLMTTSLFDLSAKFETAQVLRSISRLESSHYLDLTASEWLDAHVEHPSVRELILATFRLGTYVNAPDLMSAALGIGQLQKALAKNVLYLDGGWQSLVDRLRGAAQETGVEILSGAKAALVQRAADGSVRAVHMATGEVVEARTVVIASSPAVAAELIENAGSSSLAAERDQATPVKVASLDVGLQRLAKPRATFALGVDRPYYYSVHSAAASLAPNGGAMIHVSKYLAPGEKKPDQTVKAELEGVLDLMQPGWRDDLVCSRFLPEVSAAHAIPTAKRSGLAGRPEPLVEDVPGLYLAGDWVGKEGWLVDASLASAKRCAELIAGNYDA